MAVIGVDSSGQVRGPPIWIVAVRETKREGQDHYGIYISKQEHDSYIDFSDKWAEKLFAALVYGCVIGVNPRGKDQIIIDVDIQGNRKDEVRRYLWRIFGKNHYGTELSKPPIDFATPNNERHVKRAHIKSKQARYGSLRPVMKNWTGLKRITAILE